MRPFAAGLALIALASCGCPQQSCGCFQQQQQPPQWGVELVLYDPLSTDASTVDEVHRDHRRAVCHVGADRPDVMLQLCRDKGFDGVAFAPEVVSAELLARAYQLGLSVFTAPADTEGSKTTSDS
jgi:hypothetical protein